MERVLAHDGIWDYEPIEGKSNLVKERSERLPGGGIL